MAKVRRLARVLHCSQQRVWAILVEVHAEAIEGEARVLEAALSDLRYDLIDRLEAALAILKK
jgi:hypothetical protein